MHSFHRCTSLFTNELSPTSSNCYGTCDLNKGYESQVEESEIKEDSKQRERLIPFRRVCKNSGVFKGTNVTHSLIMIFIRSSKGAVEYVGHVL